MTASPTTVKYGDSVLLDITAVSLNPTYDNITMYPWYYIYGGDLDMDISVPGLFSMR